MLTGRYPHRTGSIDTLEWWGLERLALRESREAKALEIENKRRKALGEELLSALNEEEVDEDSADAAAEGDVPEADEEDKDVLLTEAGNILVDALTLRQQAFALRQGKSKD